MKKLLIILGSIVLLFVLTIILVPVLFKDRIITAVQTEIDNSVNAHVNFDPDKISISLLSSFPNLTLGVQDLSITGKDVFESDTLFSAKNFSVEMDIVAIIKGEPLSIKGIVLDEPLINILVLKDGSANYDITYPSDTEEPAEEESADEFKFGIEHWEINNGRIMYLDQLYEVALSLKGVNHSGKGDFTLSVFDMQTNTEVDDFSFAYGGDVYVSHKILKADLLLGMDLDSMKFSFKDAKASLNDFKLNFDGFFAMPTDDYEMDIRFSTIDTQFKSILSIVPGMYSDGFNDLQTKGEFDFSGYIKGIYSDEKMPGFSMDLAVRDASVKSPEIPLPIEKIAMVMHMESLSGDMKDGKLEVENFGLTIDKDRFTAKAKVHNFDSPSWDLSMQGGLNLDIISKIKPSDEYTLGGIITANITSKGSYADVEKEDYSKLETSGELKMQKFSYSEKDAPTFKIANAAMDFNPQSINLSALQGNYGKSDFSLTGSLSNYIAYVVDKEAIIKGNMTLTSTLLDINDMMGTSEETETAEDTTAMEVVVIPRDIDFTFNATAQTIKYDNFELKNSVGQIKVQDGILTLDPMKFDMLGGSIKMTGLYNSQDEYQPKFDFRLDISELSIRETFENVLTVKKFVPIAEKMEGKFSTDFSVHGVMTQEMSPDMATLAGSGLIKITDAAVKDSKVISAVSALSKLDNTDEVRIKDVMVQAEIKDGRLSVEPFDVNMGKYKATVDGSTGLDGDIAYNLKMNVPTGSIGKAANSAISDLLGQKVNAVGSSVNLNFNITGTYDDPKVRLGKTSTEGGESESVVSSVKAQVGDKIKDEKEKLKAEVEAKAQIAKDSAKAEAERAKEKAEEEAKKKLEEEKEKAKKKAKNKLKDIFGDG